MNEYKIGDKVMVPRTIGYYSLGTIVSIKDDRAVCEFPIGKTFRGNLQTFADEAEMATKNVALTQLMPVNLA